MASDKLVAGEGRAAHLVEEKALNKVRSGIDMSTLLETLIRNWLNKT